MFKTTGKREAAPGSQPAAVTKKQKTEQSVTVKSSAIASLAAYGEGDSSDEEGSAYSDDNQESPQKRGNEALQHVGRMPFWAVRR